MFCPKCGAENAAGGKFCVKCGAALPETAPASPESSAPVAATPAASVSPKRSVLPLAIAGVVVVAIIAVAVFVLPGVFGGIFGGGKDDVQDRANAGILTYGMASPAGDYSYFYCYPSQGIVRMKPGQSELETVLAVPDSTEVSYKTPAFYVTRVAADGDLVFYTTMHYDNDTNVSVCELRCVASDGSDDRLLLDLSNQDMDDAYTSVNGLYAYDGRVYVVLQEGSYEADMTSIRIVSLDASGEGEARTECTLDDYYGNVIVTPDKLYYVKTTYNPDGVNYSQVYASNIDGSDATRIYSTEGKTVTEFALAHDDLVMWCYDSVSSTQEIVLLDPESGEAQTLYESAYGEWIGLLAVSEDAVYLESADANAYDISEWDLKRVPLGGGEAETLAENLGYYNATAFMSNGYLVVMENGQDISSSAMRVMVLDPDTGKVVEEYV